MVQTITVNGCNYGPTITVSVGASPFTFNNPENVPIWVVVSGGTVTDVSMAPDLLSFLSLGLLGGGFHLNPRHSIKVTYILAPTMSYWPL